MKTTKRIIAVIMAVIMVSAVMAGCSFGGGSKPAPTTAPAASSQDGGIGSQLASAVDSATSSAADDEDTTETLTGTGDNASLAFSLTLFNIEYTVGKSRVKDLTDNNWGMDPEDWKDVDLNEKIEYKSTGGYYKTLDNSTTEVEISYKNLAETFATPEQCIISQMSFKGSPDGAITKAGVKAFGGKVDLTKWTSIDAIDTELSKIFSSYTKETNAYTYSSYYYYEAELTDGTVRIDVSEDNEDNSISNINISLNLNYDFTYSPD